MVEKKITLIINKDMRISRNQQELLQTYARSYPTFSSPAFFDNRFTALDLLLYLKQRGILACGIKIRANRLKGCPLKETKEMKAEGRGALEP